MSCQLYHEVYLLDNVLIVCPVSSYLHLQIGNLKKKVLFFGNEFSV